MADPFQVFGIALGAAYIAGLIYVTVQEWRSR